MSEDKDFISLSEFRKTATDEEIRKRLKKIKTELNKGLEEHRKKFIETMEKARQDYEMSLKPLREQFKRFYEENKDVLDRIDEWEEITGLTMDELDQMEVNEAFDLIREKMNLFSIPVTKYPNNFVIPKDKVTNSLFDGKLSIGTNPVATEGKGKKKELTAVVSIDFEELPGVEIVSKRPLTAYDREVHDAIVSLYVDGENQYITPLMIYRTMTGNPEAKLTPKNEKAIVDSVNTLSMTRIIIDAKEEAKGYNLDQLIYKGNLLYSKSIMGKHKGKTDEWIYIMEMPIMFKYANSKGQVARVDIKLLNTPVNKNEETVVLQGYLLKRILTMKNNPKISRNILCETIYKQLDIQASTDGALRKKQTKIRNSAKEIFADWIDKKFIKGFSENKGANNSIVSFTIHVD